MSDAPDDDGTAPTAVIPTEWELMLLRAIANAAEDLQVADAARSIDSGEAIYTTTAKYLETRACLNECLETLRCFRERRVE